MTDTENKATKINTTYPRWAIISTIVYLFFGFLLAYYKRIFTLELNAIGDFLAGFTSPLAFFWLVLGYFQQQKELNLNTEALKMQSDELAAQVEQFKQHTKQLEQQTEIFIENQRIELSESLPDISFKCFTGKMRKNQSSHCFYACPCENLGNDARNLSITFIETGCHYLFITQNQHDNQSETKLLKKHESCSLQFYVKSIETIEKIQSFYLTYTTIYGDNYKRLYKYDPNARSFRQAGENIKIII